MHSRISLLFVLVINVVLCAQFRYKKEQHSIHQLNRHQIQHLARLSDVDHLNSVLDNILIPRVVETPTHTKVYKYIKKQLEDNDFTVEVDMFKDNVPIFGSLTFKNIIGVLNPNAERFLVLACHYDSKYFANFEFLAATDSAVPCAMMLNLIKTMKSELQAVKNNDVSLMLLFLDGEEAFHQWSDTDSIYGARNLAKKFDNSLGRSANGESVSMLDRMDVFVLLDLLGTPNPTFYSYFPDTDRHYLTLSRAEDALAKSHLLSNHKRKYFQEKRYNSHVEDDHLPFMRKGVPILHIIPSPFPKVWHKVSDDRTAIDVNTIENLNKIFRVFVAEYLHVPLSK